MTQASCPSLWPSVSPCVSWWSRRPPERGSPGPQAEAVTLPLKTTALPSITPHSWAGLATIYCTATCSRELCARASGQSWVCLGASPHAVYGLWADGGGHETQTLEGAVKGTQKERRGREQQGSKKCVIQEVEFGPLKDGNLSL